MIPGLVDCHTHLVFGGDRAVEFERALPVARSGWYHLRVEGHPYERFPLDADYALAFTNPLHGLVRADTQPVTPGPLADDA